MSLWSRIANVFRGDSLNHEIDEELASHIEEAIEKGRDPEEARRAFGSTLRQRESSRDVRLIFWLDSLRADVVFGWRQLKKRKVISAAAILSLGLAIGACTAAFRLIDALLLRPLPIAEPEHLYALSHQGIGFDGKPQTFDGWAYPAFELMRAAVKGQAELIAVSNVERADLTYGSDQEMEKAYVQYVSGWMFDSLGLRPTLGRLLSENDDLKPKAHPYAVLSYDYWTHRFGHDPKVIGRTFRMGNDLYQIIGVGPERFTGTETGTFTSIFIPTMMHAGVNEKDWTWHRTLAWLKPGVPVSPLRENLHAISLAFERERAKGFTGMPKNAIEQYLKQRVVLEPAPAGVSGMQKNYRRALVVLGVLVALVLLIACANVANLMTAKAASRAREMALRVSIGAGRRRLMQLVLVESAMLACFAALIGALFAWWAAPFVVNMINPPDNPARLSLPADWRVLGFGIVLITVVIFLFGFAPALRASAIQPATALKGGDDPHSRRRLVHVLIAAQTAFCFLVVFIAGLFVATFEHLSHQPTGFSADRLLTLDSVAKPMQSTLSWYQMADHLRTLPGVEQAAVAAWPLFSGNAQNNFISVNGATPGEELVYFLSVSPDWFSTMKIPLIAGRDFRDNDTRPGAVIVNQAFAAKYFPDENPIGKSFVQTYGNQHFQIVGLVRDARYRNMREPITPTAYTALRLEAKSESLSSATFLVRTSSANPLSLAPFLRKEVSEVRSQFRVSNIRTQEEINESQAIRERLLAMLAFFFGVVALLLAGIGLYGVLDYSVLQQRREIGIRMALGAQVGNVARRVTTSIFVMVLVGALSGAGLGMISARYVEALLYQVKPTDAVMLAIPSMILVATALLAALPGVVRAVRIDPATALRAE